MSHFKDPLRAALVRNSLAIDPSGPHLVVVDVAPWLPSPGTFLTPGPFQVHRHRLSGTPLNLSLEECVWYLTNPVGNPSGFVWSDFDDDLAALLIKPKALRTAPHPKVVEACEDPVYNSWLTDLEKRQSLMTDSLLKSIPKRFRFIPDYASLLDLETGRPITADAWGPFQGELGLTFEEVVGILELTPRPKGRPRCNLPKEAR